MIQFLRKRDNNRVTDATLIFWNIKWWKY